ncbi:outer membrane beta-barrel protein [Chryseobacterium sp. FH2]|uniref:outer membrane beta-barrel protein n=1 Tax=Chryseobacterium sp. FH2 TaxID=1674291 RepID=UPI000B24BE6E|nr:outer membrane beta-barrel protein [Chryseobacterium sp. FH2]
MDDQWLNNLRNKMEDHSEDVPDGLWDAIRDELFYEGDENKIIRLNLENELKAQEKSAQIDIKTKIYRAVGIAAVLAACFFVGKELLNLNTSEQKKASTKVYANKDNVKTVNKTSETQHASIRNENIIPKQTFRSDNCLNSSVLTQNVKKNISGQKLREEKTNDNIFLKPQEESKATNLFSQNQSIAKENQVVTENVNPAEKGEENKELLADNQNILSPKSADEAKQKTPKSTKWMLSMLTGNASSGSAEQFPGYATAAGKPMSVAEVYQSSDGDPFVEVLLANQNKEVEARVRHKTPVTFGLSLYYNLGKRWGIGTGMNYTKLSSEIHSGSSTNYIRTDQSVHYIGIPVQVNYNIVKKGRFTGYITAGALAEKAISGKQKTQYVVDNIVKDEFTEKVDVTPLQVSVNSAAGLQFKVIHNIGIYAEPGVAYHFRDDSQLNTIYKEKPFNFNMKFGIRLQID